MSDGVKNSREMNKENIVWKVGDKRSFVHQFTKEQVEKFAQLTGDMNPLHIDENYARQTSAGGPVIHGMLAASFVSTLIGMHIPGPGALWQSFQVNWLKMIRVGDSIRFEVSVITIQQASLTFDVAITGRHIGNNEICLEGKGRVMMMSEPKPDQTPVSGISGQRILVTGATGELGRSICHELARRNARLILYGRDQKRLAEMASEYKKNVESQHAIDLTDTQQIDHSMNEILRGGDLYGFIHAAAPPLEYVTVDDPKNGLLMEVQWRVNVAAFYQISRHVVSRMTQGGSIIHVLTQYVFDAPPPKMSAYLAAKMAAWGLIRAMAVELGPKGIRCNAISPGLMNTPYSKDVPVRMKQVEAASNPMRRLCTVEDIAKTVVFLCGTEAAFINGVNLPVTGGARMP